MNKFLNILISFSVLFQCHKAFAFDTSSCPAFTKAEVGDAGDKELLKDVKQALSIRAAKAYDERCQAAVDQYNKYVTSRYGIQGRYEWGKEFKAKPIATSSGVSEYRKVVNGVISTCKKRDQFLASGIISKGLKASSAMLSQSGDLKIASSISALRMADVALESLSSNPDITTEILKSMRQDKHAQFMTCMHSKLTDRLFKCEERRILKDENCDAETINDDMVDAKGCIQQAEQFLTNFNKSFREISDVANEISKQIQKTDLKTNPYENIDNNLLNKIQNLQKALNQNISKDSKGSNVNTTFKAEMCALKDHYKSKYEHLQMMVELPELKAGQEITKEHLAIQLETTTKRKSSLISFQKSMKEIAGRELDDEQADIMMSDIEQGYKFVNFLCKLSKTSRSSLTKENIVNHLKTHKVLSDDFARFEDSIKTLVSTKDSLEVKPQSETKVTEPAKSLFDQFEQHQKMLEEMSLKAQVSQNKLEMLAAVKRGQSGAVATAYDAFMKGNNYLEENEDYIDSLKEKYDDAKKRYHDGKIDRGTFFNNYVKPFMNTCLHSIPNAYMSDKRLAPSESFTNLKSGTSWLFRIIPNDYVSQNCAEVYKCVNEPKLIDNNDNNWMAKLACHAKSRSEYLNKILDQSVMDLHKTSDKISAGRSKLYESFLKHFEISDLCKIFDDKLKY